MKKKYDIALIDELRGLKGGFNKEYEKQTESRKKFFADTDNRESVERAKIALEVAEKLYHARKKAGLTQVQLAEKLHTSQASLARIEKGANLSLFMIAAYAGACGKHVRINIV